MNKQMKKLITELALLNTEFVDDVRTVMSQPDEKVVELNTRVQFKDKEQARLFADVFRAETTE